MSGSYKIWTGNNEIYLLERSVGQVFKVSLHKSGNWHIAFTLEFINKKGIPKENRYFERWKAPFNNIGNGVTLAFKIRIPESELRKIPIDTNENKIEWLKAPEKGHYIEIDIIHTKNKVTFPEDWPTKDLMNTSLLKEIKLLNNDSLWILCHYQPTSVQQIIELNDLRTYYQKISENTNAKKPKVIAMLKEDDGSRQFLEIALYK